MANAFSGEGNGTGDQLTRDSAGTTLIARRTIEFPVLPNVPQQSRIAHNRQCTCHSHPLAGAALRRNGYLLYNSPGVNEKRTRLFHHLNFKVVLAVRLLRLRGAVHSRIKLSVPHELLPVADHREVRAHTRARQTGFNIVLGFPFALGNVT